MQAGDNRRDDLETAPETGQSLSFQEHLINVLENASAYSDEIDEHLRRNAFEVDHSPKENSRMRRRAVTMRDSLSQMARILRGEDLDEEPVIESQYVQRRLREAYIFQKIVPVQRQLRQADQWGERFDYSQANAELEAVLDFIKNDEEIPDYGEDNG